jgi:putative ABC transport system permease protein
MAWRKRSQRDFDEELRSHLDLEADALAGEGTPAAEARQAARRALGSPLAAAERFYEGRRLLWLDHLWQDLRYAVRTLSRAPAFAFAALATLALGVGVNIAIFSVVRAVLLEPLPYVEPGRIVALEPFYKNTGRTGTVVSAPDFHDWRRRNRVFERLAYHTGGEGPLLVHGAASLVDVQTVTTDFFGVFGLPPHAGRFWDEHENRTAVAVVSHGWAQQHFGDGGRALGQSVKVRGKTVEVVGVAAPGFRYPATADIWIPAGLFDENPHRAGHNYFALGRLRPGVTLDAAQREMRQIGDALGAQYVENRHKTVTVTRLSERITQRAKGTLWVLLAAVIGVLLISCANVANLQLARTALRSREMALRVALGAGRSRIVRQMLTESALLGALGALAGLALAALLLEAIPAIAPADVPHVDQVRIDGPLLAFALLLGAGCSLVFGLAPARAATAPVLQAALRQPGTGSASHVSDRTRRLLIVAEVALSTVLLASAVLLMRSFVELTSVDLGFSPTRVLLTSTSIPADSEDKARRATELQRTLIERINALPGVRRAAGVRTTPFAARQSTATYRIDDGQDDRPGEAPSAHAQTITPGYFEAMGIAIRRGRDFTDRDTWGRPQAAIVNETLARQAFGQANPLGRTIRSRLSLESQMGMAIVGVVADARQIAPGEAPRPEIFVPYLQHPSTGSNLTLVVRTGLEPAALSSVIRATAKALDSELPVRFSTMDAIVHESLAYPRFRAALTGLFALLAVSLAVVGIYGVLSYLVSQRRVEIGVRLALGASPGRVFVSVVGSAMRPVVWGLAAGTSGTLALSPALRTFLFGITPHDPATLVAVVITLALAALAGSSVPAFRAARADPLIPLREP